MKVKWEKGSFLQKEKHLLEVDGAPEFSGKRRSTWFAGSGAQGLLMLISASDYLG